MYLQFKISPPPTHWAVLSIYIKRSLWLKYFSMRLKGTDESILWEQRYIWYLSIVNFFFPRGKALQLRRKSESWVLYRRAEAAGQVGCRPGIERVQWRGAGGIVRVRRGGGVVTGQPYPRVQTNKSVQTPSSVDESGTMGRVPTLQLTHALTLALALFLHVNLSVAKFLQGELRTTQVHHQ